MMGYDAQVVLALGISVTLSLAAWGWPGGRLWQHWHPFQAKRRRTETQVSKMLCRAIK
jgi:hypothetical protein